MIPGNLPLEVQQGDTANISLNWCNPGTSPTSPGPQINLTGYSGVMEFRAVAGGPVLFSLSTAAPTANGSTLTLGGSAFNVIGYISPADAQTLQSGVWNCTLTDPYGGVYTIVAGTFNVLPLGE